MDCCATRVRAARSIRQLLRARRHRRCRHRRHRRRRRPVCRACRRRRQTAARFPIPRARFSRHALCPPSCKVDVPLARHRQSSTDRMRTDTDQMRTRHSAQRCGDRRGGVMKVKRNVTRSRTPWRRPRAPRRHSVPWSSSCRWPRRRKAAAAQLQAIGALPYASCGTSRTCRGTSRRGCSPSMQVSVACSLRGDVYPIQTTRTPGGHV